MGIPADAEGWSTRLVRGIADEVKRRRTELGWSAQKLSGECAALGFDFPRSTLADLESGRRKQISVPELIALAAALHVPPLLLVYPVGRQGETEALPGITRPAFRTAEWFSGAAFLPGPDDAGVVTKITSDVEWPGQALVLYREHDRAFNAEQEALDGARTGPNVTAWHQLAIGFRSERERLQGRARELGIRPPDAPEVWLVPDEDEKPETSRDDG